MDVGIFMGTGYLVVKPVYLSIKVYGMGIGASLYSGVDVVI